MVREPVCKTGTHRFDSDFGIYKDVDMYKNYAQPQDIVRRLMYRKLHWFHGPPTISIHGEGAFVTLRFAFGDEDVDLTIYRKTLEDGNKILDAAVMAIENFIMLSFKILEEK